MRPHLDIQGGSFFRDAAANAAVAHNALAAILGLEISMLGEKIRDLGLDRLRQQRARPLPQDFGELIVKASWLNQLEHVIVRHGISLLRWRSGGVKHPHDMPPFRFLPSPTFSDSSQRSCSQHSCSHMLSFCSQCSFSHVALNALLSSLCYQANLPFSERARTDPVPRENPYNRRCGTGGNGWYSSRKEY